MDALDTNKILLMSLPDHVGIMEWDCLQYDREFCCGSSLEGCLLDNGARRLDKIVAINTSTSIVGRPVEIDGDELLACYGGKIARRL